MNQSENELSKWSDCDLDSDDLDSLEDSLELELNEDLEDLRGLEIEHDKIGNPDTVGQTIKDVVWEQFLNQVGVTAGEDFIKENRDLTLDLRDSAHIQTTENFEKGKIATHNTSINYQERYDKWQAKLEHDENGRVKTHTTRTGKQEANLARGARRIFDQGRPTGSAERGTDMDHRIPAGEIIRDPRAQAHLSESEQVEFANSPKNLQEIPSDQNRSKKDLPTTVWLDTPNKNGQKPNEIFDISEEDDRRYRENDAEARDEWEKRKSEGEQRSLETGKQSQRDEAFRIGGKALRSAIMGLFASLVKDIIRKLVAWFRSGKKNFKTFIASVKKGLHTFFSNIKKHVLNAGSVVVTTIATAIFGPIIGMIKKAWIFLKQGWKSLKDAVKFLKNPANKNMPFGIKLAEVGKILVAGLAAGGAILLSEDIEKGLMTIPIFAFPIPLLGSLASLIGMFLGGLISGLIGALALRCIDKWISKRLKAENIKKQIDKKNEIIQKQDVLMEVTTAKVAKTKGTALINIVERHKEAGEAFKGHIATVSENVEKSNANYDKSSEIHSQNEDLIDDLFNKLNDLK